EDRAHCRLADVAAELALAMPGQHLFETGNTLYADDVVEFLAGMGEVLAQAAIDHHAPCAQLMLEDLFEQRAATAAAGAGLGIGFQLAEIGDASVDLATLRPLADVVAGEDGGRRRQRIDAQRQAAPGLR